ncbi:MAG: hypothetical protein IIW13_04850 [Paludibacteraceae bacterium]|nr:hypothetical protein [Paludibacteraceae bacterium]
MKKFVAFIRKEIVLCVAIFLAIAGIVACRPNSEHIKNSIDLRVITLLFCLMYVIQGFSAVNILDKLAGKMLSVCKTTRQMVFTLTYLVFFISMIVTNDVALITFVPISLIICKKINLQNTNPGLPAKIIVLETIAANLGSCITPMGNPQNLFLFNFYEMESGEFFETTLKIGIPSFFICGLLAFLITRKGETITAKYEEKPITAHPIKLILLTILLVLSLLSVFRILEYRLLFAIVMIIGVMIEPKVFLRVDYALLFTFVGFFLFTGSVSSMEAVSVLFEQLLKTPPATYLAGLTLSQLISNVPAALLLSSFTENSTELLAAVNVAGLGTLIASLASVISYKLFKSFQEETASSPQSYFATFTKWNFMLLPILAIIVYFLL